jgi:hypothetical protein
MDFANGKRNENGCFAGLRYFTQNEGGGMPPMIVMEASRLVAGRSALEKPRPSIKV